MSDLKRRYEQYCLYRCFFLVNNSNVDTNMAKIRILNKNQIKCYELDCIKYKI